ncbi:flagellar protein FlaG [Desulfovibrio psychrotolerans]|uniref:Uncharacterized protein n=1 Tax=Desulfovibrio psychrotolerans TaxID=415242 RepID=A0A7J0BNU7_9BACT|nr:flagellar protein FlaG [Desulfovibrio psychrotolerans]GFM35373.1 hypothetical protein DSM19430T_00570 [Desulfovibrio psychrotolerans]
MRLLEIQSGLLNGYGEFDTARTSTPEGNTTAPHPERAPSHSHGVDTGNELHAASDHAVDTQAVQNAASALQSRLADQGVRLKFEVVRSEQGRIEVEVTDEAHDKVLMRIPPKGVLTVNAQGASAIGVFLNLRS